MSKKMVKLISIMGMITFLGCSAINTVQASDTLATTTPVATATTKQLTKDDFKLAKYLVNGKRFAGTFVDNFVNPTKFWNCSVSSDNIKNFNTVNDFLDLSSNVNDYVPEGYKFIKWEDSNTKDFNNAEIINAVLERDDNYINNLPMQDLHPELLFAQENEFLFLGYDLPSDYKITSYSVESEGHNFKYIEKRGTLLRPCKSEFDNNLASLNSKLINSRKGKFYMPIGWVNSWLGDKFILTINVTDKFGRNLKKEIMFDRPSNLTYFGDYIYTYNGPTNCVFDCPKDLYVGDSFYIRNCNMPTKKILISDEYRPIFNCVDFTAVQEGNDIKITINSIPSTKFDPHIEVDGGPIVFSKGVVTLHHSRDYTLEVDSNYWDGYELTPDLIHKIPVNKGTDTPMPVSDKPKTTTTPVINPLPDKPKSTGTVKNDVPVVSTSTASSTIPSKKDDTNMPTSDTNNYLILIGVLGLAIVGIVKCKKVN